MTSTSTPPPSGLQREFTLWSAFTFAFAFISPIVALYGIFGLAISTAGPSFWWGFLVVLIGQLLVALVFAALVSRWPHEGSIYQWTRRLAGPTGGWFAGWAYMCTLVIAMTTVALGAAGFVGGAFGLDMTNPATKAALAIGILIAGTVLNLVGRQALKVFMGASIAAEMIGSIGLGVWLLLFHRENSPAILLTGGHGVGMESGYWGLTGPFVAALVFIGFSFVGFESAGAIAEEVREPERNLPKAVITSLLLVGVVVMFASFSLILAIPDLSSVDWTTVADPVSFIITTQLSPGLGKPLQVLFAIGFSASFLALQTSASRVIWAYARDRALPGSASLSRLSTRGIPTIALTTVTAIGLVILAISFLAGDIYGMLVNFTSGGFYIAFLFPVLGFLVTVLRRRWTPGRFSLGTAAPAIAIVATAWLTFELINIAWPRAAFGSVLLDWGVIIGMAILTVIGAVVYSTVSRTVTGSVPDRDIPAEDVAVAAEELA